MKMKATGKITFGAAGELYLEFTSPGNERSLMERMNQIVTNIIQSEPKWAYKIETTLVTVDIEKSEVK